jgi:hypothetical protein
MDIETKSASLDTLAVTIQALHVNGKQMTLAVFRQLPKAHALKKDGELADFEFWGLVRYPIKDEGDLWAVASNSGILYRCDAAPYFESVEDALRNKKSAIVRLEFYRKWEPAKLAWDDYERLPWGSRGEKPSIERPEYRRGLETGIEQDYIDAVELAQRRIELAYRRQESISKLAELPQLFIAV